jgi:hypothetical protein
MDLMLVLKIVFAGLAGTTAMILLMGLIHGLKWAEADMVRAIGSLYTEEEEGALPVGLVVHMTGGVFFAFLYALLISVAPIPPTSPGAVFLVCLLAGVFHGFVVSIFLAVVVAEYHPLKRFQKAGVDVVLSHLAGHVAYGATVGLVFVLSHVRMGVTALW